MASLWLWPVSTMMKTLTPIWVCDHHTVWPPGGVFYIDLPGFPGSGGVSSPSRLSLASLWHWCPHPDIQQAWRRLTVAPSPGVLPEPPWHRKLRGSLAPCIFLVVEGGSSVLYHHQDQGNGILVNLNLTYNSCQFHVNQSLLEAGSNGPYHALEPEQ